MPIKNDEIVASGPQPAQPGESLSGLVKAGVGVAGISALGFIPTKSGHVWDQYLNVIRAVESGFPGGVLKTFRMSEYLSVLESWERGSVDSSILKSGGHYADYLRTTFGPGLDDLSMTRSGSIFGDVTSGGRTIGMGLRIESGTQKGAGISDYYARVGGMTLGSSDSLTESILKAEYDQLGIDIPFSEWKKALTPAERKRHMILGARFRKSVNVFGKNIALSTSQQRMLAKAEVGSKLLRAKAASTAGRLNNLLTKPFEVPVVGNILHKIPLIKSVGIDPGTSTQMMGRYVKKGMLIGAAYKGLTYYDYLRSEGSAATIPIGGLVGAAAGGMLFNKPGMRFNKYGAAIGAAAGLYTALAPRFDEGLFYGVASYFTDADVARAETSETLGVSESLRRQDEITPGLISSKTALGFTGFGALATGLGMYGNLLYKSGKQKIASGAPLGEIFDLTRHTITQAQEDIWKTGIGSKIASTKGIGKLVSKVKNPYALGAMAGFAAWTGISSGLSLLSGNVAAAVPGLNLLGSTDDPEQLKRIYSGEEDVAVRKGRWWEFGRCLMISTTCKLLFDKDKEAKDIKVGDMLLGRKGQKAEVLNIFTRHYKGECLLFSTALDRDVETGITPNHIVPVLNRLTGEVKEIPAEEIKVNDYVETPIRHRKSTTKIISVSSIIKEPLVVENYRLFATQKNWYSGSTQKSAKHSFPQFLSLDKNLGSLLGYFLAEGSISFNKGNPTVIETAHAKHERWIVDDIIRISELIFDITPTVRFKKGKKKTDEGCWVVRICSAVAAKFFRWSFYPQKEYNKNNKQVPDWCMNAIPEFKEAFIEGYYIGDGHYYSAKTISSARKEILVKIQEIAFSIGRLCSIGPKEENNYLGRWRLRFVSDVSTNPALVYYKDRVFAAIRSIRVEEYDDIVYDFEVSHSDHLFVAGTFLVHNSSGYEGGRVEYYRPHAIHRLRTRAYQKGLYGTEEEMWEHDPMLNPLKTLFGSDEWKYHYDEKYAYERPAPLCLHPDTPVLTKEGGYKQIKDIVRGDKVYNSDGEWTEVTFTANRDCYEKELIEINIASDNRAIKVTPDHKVLAIKNLWTNRRNDKCRDKRTIVEYGAPEWISAKEIFKNDLVLIPVPKTKSVYLDFLDLKTIVPYICSGDKVFFGHEIDRNIADAYMSDLPTSIAAKEFDVSYKRLYQLKKRRPKTIDRYLKIDDDFAYLLGWYIAKGWIGNQQGVSNLSSNVSFALCSDEQYVIDFLSDYSKRRFNATVSVCNCSENGIQARINSTVLAIALKYLVGKTKAVDKVVPDFVFDWPIELKQQFIKGLVRGDGHYKKPSKKSKGEINFISASSGLASSLRLLLLSIGIKSSFREQLPNENWKEARINGRIIPKNKSYVLSINGLDYDLFAEFEEKITKINSTVSHKGILYDHMMFVPVRETKIIPYDGQVYDITVQGKSCFLTTCIVHNSSTYGDDIPFIGPLVAATFGKLLKPRKTVREDEWNLGGGEYLHRPDPRPENEPAYELGGLDPGAPVAPDSPSQLLNELNYRRREAVGLVGFAEGAMTKALTGREEFMANQETLATMGGETGAEYWLWSHLNVGGASGTSEVVRRFIPRTRSYLDTYNPLENNMPSWLPDDYFIDLKHGNPFDKIKEAEIRLPGAGYAALNPEVAGLDPEEYPMMHRLKILGDVAMWSNEYKGTLRMAKARRKDMSEYDRQLLDRIEQQVQSKKISKEFQEYRFDESQLEQQQVTVTDIIDPSTIRTKELGEMNVQLQGLGKILKMDQAREFAKENLLGKQIDIFTPSMRTRGIDLVASGGRQKAVAMIDGQDYGEMISEAGLVESRALEDEFEQLRFSGREQLAGRISENILHGMDTPLDMLTPMSPVSKLIRQRSALEDYARTQAVGTGNAFWDKPWENFISPAIESAEYDMGDTEIPENIQQRRAIQKYFDMLKWVKAKRTGDIKAESQTMFGVDVFASPQNVMRALPRPERDYFKAFSEVRSQEERQQILELVPENEQRIYRSIWMRQEEEVARARKKAKIDTDYDEKVLAATQTARMSEGFEVSPELQKQWMDETGGEIPFDEWIRKKKADAYFATHSLPGADWIGWHPSVDLDDVKLKYVENAGLDHHDYDLWGDRLKSLARKPYIDQETIAQLQEADTFTSDERIEMSAHATAKIYSDGSTEGSAQVRKIDADIEPSYNIEIQDGRSDQIAQAYKYMGVR